MAVIDVQALSKRYVISHQATKGHVARYNSLRETIVEMARGAFARASPQNESREEFWALREVSFKINAGDVVGVIGRNGAGKSTLLKILSRITEPTSGRIRIRGRLASLLEVGTGFHPELTGRENIYLNGAILGMSRVEIQRKFDEIVAFSEIEKFLDTPVKRYSSGMYVRLAFAVAAHLEPEILIVDEVLAVGDAEFQKKCLGKLQDVANNQGRTVFFVSHNLGALASLCTRGIVLEHGRVIADDTIDKALFTYSNRANSTNTVFDAKKETPAITGVELDEDALRIGGLRVTVRFTSPVPLNPPVVGVVVSSQRGTPLFGSNTLTHPEGLSMRPLKEGFATLNLGELPLHSGSYRLSIWLGDKTQNYDSKIDIITFDHVARRQISGQYNVEVIGPMNLPASWTVEEWISVPQMTAG